MTKVLGKAGKADGELVTVYDKSSNWLPGDGKGLHVSVARFRLASSPSPGASRFAAEQRNLSGEVVIPVNLARVVHVIKTQTKTKKADRQMKDISIARKISH